jgi:hypothetical protein
MRDRESEGSEVPEPGSAACRYGLAEMRRADGDVMLVAHPAWPPCTLRQWGPIGVQISVHVRHINGKTNHTEDKSHQLRLAQHLTNEFL